MHRQGRKNRQISYFHGRGKRREKERKRERKQSRQQLSLRRDTTPLIRHQRNKQPQGTVYLASTLSTTSRNRPNPPDGMLKLQINLQRSSVSTSTPTDAYSDLPEFAPLEIQTQTKKKEERCYDPAIHFTLLTYFKSASHETPTKQTKSEP